MLYNCTGSPHQRGRQEGYKLLGGQHESTESGWNPALTFTGCLTLGSPLLPGASVSPAGTGDEY